MEQTNSYDDLYYRVVTDSYYTSFNRLQHVCQSVICFSDTECSNTVLTVHVHVLYTILMVTFITLVYYM